MLDSCLVNMRVYHEIKPVGKQYRTCGHVTLTGMVE
jgi:hypothetical protein